tara:strand:+ start:2420 stop:2770 length:351 start_codon:yes stop_codon:yes gene_type:complete
MNTCYFYLAKVQDLEGNWWRKVGITKFPNPKDRFSESRFYKDSKILKFIEIYVDSANYAEATFKDMQIGNRWIEYKVPTWFMGKTELIRPDITDEQLIQRFDSIDIPTQATLKDFQ